MLIAYGYYETQLKEASKKLKYCFVCATRAVVQCEHTEIVVSLKVTEDGCYFCDCCGNMIDIELTA
jgi:hypothetical protein